MKRHYAEAGIHEDASGYMLLLDGKPALTPMGRKLTVPNAELAQALAEEWNSQPETLRKDRMLLTQLACIALDLAADKRELMTKELLEYADTDLVCYRAGTIPELAERQQRLLTPVIAWAEDRFTLKFLVTGALIPVKQPPQNAVNLKAMFETLNAWQLALLAFVIKPLGSTVLGLAFLNGRIDVNEAFVLSHQEEIFETEKWGEDAEKEIKLQSARDDIAAAARFLTLI